jgi:tRNA(Arg) A34 adenosine deaminase TadA
MTARRLPKSELRRVLERTNGEPLPALQAGALTSLPLKHGGLRRRHCLIAALPGSVIAARPAHATPLHDAMRQAEALRDEAVRSGDQPFGAVVLRGDTVVGAAPSRVVTGTDPTAHAEMEAIRDAARRLRTRDLAGCVLVSTSRPCRMCEAAAAWAGISRMVYGEALVDAGPPR